MLRSQLIADAHAPNENGVISVKNLMQIMNL